MAKEMTILTAKQYKEAKEKVRQIEEYIRTEIIPHTNDSIYISVGNELEKNSGRHHFHLWIDSRGVSDTILGSAGHLDIYFKKEDMPSTVGGSVYIYDSWNYGGEFCYELIKDWNNIKRKLLDFRGKVERQEAETRKVFDNFKI